MQADITKDSERCSGIRLKAIIRLGIANVELHKDELDAIDIHPLPDHDTGKNMHSTMLAVWKSVKNVKGNSAGKVAEAAAQGAFQGARGCSGIILSNFFIGFSNATKEKHSITKEDFAHGLRAAADEVAKSLLEPCEGTMFSLLKRIAEASAKAVSANSEFLGSLKAVCDESKAALMDSPRDLPLLKDAGIVDAGASGLAYFFEGMLKYSTAQPISRSEKHIQIHTVPARMRDFTEEHCVEFILSGEEIAADKLTKTLTEIGRSGIISIYGKKKARIHIHVPDAKKIFDRTSRFGKPTHIKVDSIGGIKP